MSAEQSPLFLGIEKLLPQVPMSAYEYNSWELHDKESQKRAQLFRLDSQIR